MKKKIVISNKKKFFIFVAFVFIILSVSIKNISEAFLYSPEIASDDVIEFNNENTVTPPEIVDVEETIPPKKDYLLDTSYTNEEGTVFLSKLDDIHILVNKERNLPKDYKPWDLVVPNVKFSFEEKLEKRYLRQEAADALEILFEGASQDGITLYAVSGYRSYATQDGLFNRKANAVGFEEANKLVAVPGQSEHQTGLSMDVSSKSVGFSLTEDFAHTDEGIWLKNNAHKYGFIIRFPQDKTDITGYSYEPWHIRYLGTDLATEVYESGLTLEEFFQN